ncbi:MAG: imidazole glycerol phosphate synthase subunit HisH [Thaumarchaeota archaeon]|nr:imidazole glycerol phosphate synthase subunit HisH [Nitrososphaerota archaeon]
MTIFNYGAGNLFSIQAALRKEGAKPSVTKTGSGMKEADALILPGVGSFDQAANSLPMEEIREVIRSGKPTLGICLGLQLFFGGSEEGRAKGLSLLKGRVRRLPPSVKVPQIGWNTLNVERENELVSGLDKEPWVYYVNSYYPETDGKWVVATSDYGVRFPCLVAEKNFYGTQFHPEKSGATGRTILQNFLKAAKK